jgi:hypothetical protein
LRLILIFLTKTKFSADNDSSVQTLFGLYRTKTKTKKPKMKSLIFLSLSKRKFYNKKKLFLPQKKTRLKTQALPQKQNPHKYT